MERLYVIGNGFDLHHGIPSSYFSFGRYVERLDKNCFNMVREYLAFDEDFWNFFEERLATFDEDQVIDHAEQFLVSYGAEDWSDAYHHDYEYEIQQVVGSLSETLRRHFADWIRGLPIPAPGTFVPVRSIDPHSRFINFNYTPTLQRLYGVAETNILHIHGSASRPNDQIILGHGWERLPEEKLSPNIDEDTDVRVAGGYRLIDQYFSDTFKPTASIIEQHRAVFDALGCIKEIVVLGHSLSDVDAPYFSEIIERVSPSTRWSVSYHTDPSREAENFARFGISRDLVTFAPLQTL